MRPGRLGSLTGAGPALNAGARMLHALDEEEPGEATPLVITVGFEPDQVRDGSSAAVWHRGVDHTTSGDGRARSGPLRSRSAFRVVAVVVTVLIGSAVAALLVTRAARPGRVADDAPGATKSPDPQDPLSAGESTAAWAKAGCRATEPWPASASVVAAAPGEPNSTVASTAFGPAARGINSTAGNNSIVVMQCGSRQACLEAVAAAGRRLDGAGVVGGSVIISETVGLHDTDLELLLGGIREVHGDVLLDRTDLTVIARAFRSLGTVGGAVSIRGNRQLTGISLPVLRCVAGQLEVTECPALVELGGIDAVTAVGGLAVTYNAELLDLSSIAPAVVAGRLEVCSNGWASSGGSVAGAVAVAVAEVLTRHARGAPGLAGEPSVLCTSTDCSCTGFELDQARNDRVHQRSIKVAAGFAAALVFATAVLMVVVQDRRARGLAAQSAPISALV